MATTGETAHTYHIPSLHKRFIHQTFKMHSTEEAVSFSEVLVCFCLEQQGLVWKFSPTFEIIGDTLEVAKDVGTAILDLIQQANDMVVDCKKELEDSQCTGPAEFTRCALAAARYYFPKGYTHEAFLSYCAMVVGVTCMFYKEENFSLARCAAEVIGLVIIAHVLTKKFFDHGGYLKLQAVSTVYSESVRMAKTKKKKKKKAV